MKSRKVFLVVGLLLFASLAFVLSSSTAMAQEICDNGVDDIETPEDKLVDCADPDCAEAAVCQKDDGLCHNIGGPNALGANCDAGNCTLASILATGDAELIAAFGLAVARAGTAAGQIYGGIVVPFGDAAFTAHDNHGDGPVLVTFDREHHTQPHVAANVGCFAIRDNEDPGN